jgi:BCD family chlorophyll transporter-like MFS transporter
VLLEPFGAAAFDMTVEQTTQLTALWGGMTLLSLLLYGFVMNRFMTKRQGAVLGGLIAMSGLIIIALSGVFVNEGLFQPGIAVLGFGTGIATATNLGLMLDMTTPAQAGLFIGAWGVADAMSRGVGMMLGSIVRDVVTVISGDVIAGYVTVFFIEAGFLVVSLLLLRRISVDAFHKRKQELSFTELTAVADA